MIRSYRLEHSINLGKQEQVRAVVREYRKLACQITKLQWREFFQHGGFDKNLDIKHLPTPLSARYKQTCQYQVVGVLESFIANRRNDFLSLVWKSSLSSQSKLELSYINEHRLWFSNSAEITMGKGRTRAVAPEIVRLARTIFKQVLSLHHRPALRHCNLALDNKVAKIAAKSESEEKQAKKFDYWITLSTLDKGKPIALPLLSNKFFDKKGGKLKKFCQINVSEQGDIGVCLIKDVPPAADYFPQTAQIGLDLGLRTLFASDKGDLYGRNFMDVVEKYGTLITRLAQNRQRQDLPVKSRKYRHLVNKLRHFLKNEIARVLNRVRKQHSPKEIVVEKLEFKSPKLSKRLNRLLSNFGKQVVTQKLAALSEEFGIAVSHVHPAYGSQTCSKCHYVAANNRKSQSEFVCQHCHKKLHADVNGARNLRFRSSDPVLGNVHAGKSQILDKLVMQFIERFPCVHSYAHRLLAGNPYFKAFLPSGNLKIPDCQNS